MQVLKLFDSVNNLVKCSSSNVLFLGNHNINFLFMWLLINNVIIATCFLAWPLNVMFTYQMYCITFFSIIVWYYFFLSFWRFPLEWKSLFFRWDFYAIWEREKNRQKERNRTLVILKTYDITVIFIKIQIEKKFQWVCYILRL